MSRQLGNCKGLDRSNNEISQAPWKKLFSSYGNEETWDRRHKLVKDIVATAHNLNLKVREEDVEELLETDDDYYELNTHELK